MGELVYSSLLSLTFSFTKVRIFDCSEVSRSLPLDDVLLRNLLPIQLEIFDHHDVPLAISSWSGAGVDGPGWLDGDSRMGLDTIAVDIARGWAGVDGPGWLGGDSRMGLDTIAVDVARGGAGVDGPGWLGRDSRMGLDTIAVDIARGGAGVDGPGWLSRDSRMGLDAIAVDVARGEAGMTTGVDIPEE